MKKNLKIFIFTLVAVIALGGVVLGVLSVIGKNDSSIPNDPTNEISENIIEDDTEVVELNISTNNVISDNTVSEDIVSENTISDEELYADDPRVKVIDTKEDDTIVISFAGDILFDPGYATYSTYKSKGSVLSNVISEDLLETMRQADVMMVNNEFPYSDRGTPQPEKTYTFRAPTDSVKLLDEMGIDIVSVANNHVFDYGEEAFLDTLTTLEDANMPYVGAGRNIEDAAKPFYFVADGKKIGIIAATQVERNGNPDTRGATEEYGGVFRCYDPERLQQTIREMKEDCDYVILFIHWGTENQVEVDWSEDAQDDLYVEAGADLIIGAHPHILQSIGYIDGTPIVYSLGNYWFNSKSLDTGLVTVTLKKGELDSLQFVPCKQSGCTTKLLDGAEKTRVIDYMRSISSSASIDEDGFVYPACE